MSGRRTVSFLGVIGALVMLLVGAAPAPAHALDARGVGSGTVGLMRYVIDGDYTQAQKEDAELALRWLMGEQDKPGWYDDVVDLGEEGDATSLANLKNAVTYMDAVNAMRREHKLNELNVCLSLMAGAELNCSYSGEITFDHAHCYSSPSDLGAYLGNENAAGWDGPFTGSSDPDVWQADVDRGNPYGSNWPFTGWYTMEKAEYEAGNVSAAGHYVNFTIANINSFGIATGDDVTIWKGSDYEGSFTVEEFRELVSDYEASIFSDVRDSTSHAVDIWWMLDSGISEGWLMDDGTREYRGMSPVVRQDMAAFLHRLADHEGASFDESEELEFSDVSESTPHFRDILWLAATGISEGWEEGGSRVFRGMSEIVRQDMAAFLYRLAGSPEYEPSPDDMMYFDDVDESTPHYREILWLASVEVSEGWEENGVREFRGMDTVKRQDMAAFLHRMSEKGLVGQPSLSDAS